LFILVVLLTALLPALGRWGWGVGGGGGGLMNVTRFELGDLFGEDTVRYASDRRSFYLCTRSLGLLVSYTSIIGLFYLFTGSLLPLFEVSFDSLAYLRFELGDLEETVVGETRSLWGLAAGFGVGCAWFYLNSDAQMGGGFVGGARGVEEEPEVLTLTRWGAGLGLRRKDLGWLSIECLLLCTDLCGGLTSFGQEEMDKGGLRTLLVHAQVTSKGKKTAMFLLDVDSQEREREKERVAKQAGHMGLAPMSAAASASWVTERAVKGRGSGGGGWREGGKSGADAAPFSLQYRMRLLKLHRPTTWKFILWEGCEVTFDIWRSCQLRLILLLCHMALGPVGVGRGGEEGMPGKDDRGKVESEVRWKVESETREFSSKQLLKEMTRIASELAETRAPAPPLWDTYCEANYGACLARFANFLSAVVGRCPWINTYGPLSVHMLEYLIGTGVYDETGAAVVNSAEVVKMLRTVCEGTDLSEGVQVAAQAVMGLRMYLHSRNLDTLLAVEQHLALLQTLPDRAFQTSNPNSRYEGTRARTDVAPTPLPHGLFWYKVAALEEVEEGLRILLSDAHANFIDPEAEIPVAVQVYVKAHALLIATRASQAAAAPTSVLSAEAEVCRHLKASVRARFYAIVDAQALPDGTVNVEGCIDAVTNLVEEVEVEALYFAPGYSAVVSRAVGIAVLEYVTCCQHSVYTHRHGQTDKQTNKHTHTQTRTRARVHTHTHTHTGARVGAVLLHADGAGGATLEKSDGATDGGGARDAAHVQEGGKRGKSSQQSVPKYIYYPRQEYLLSEARVLDSQLSSALHIVNIPGN